jgi:Ethanolamine utilization protein EutJ (predicted chaperonin)
MTVTGVGDGTTVKDVFNAGKVIYAIEKKTDEGTWGASVHEESHQMAKDIIREMGKN